MGKSNKQKPVSKRRQQVTVKHERLTAEEWAMQQKALRTRSWLRRKAK